MLALLSPTAIALAAEFIAPGTGKQVDVPAGESHKNLYTAASTVNINGPVVGDLTVAGGNVVLNAPVSGGLLAAGGSISSNANISGNARVAGGTITINGPVGGDLVVAGGTVSISETAAVGGDLVMAGGNVTLNAPVSGNLKIMARTVLINGKINGSVNITATQSLTFGPQAQVNGTIHYRGSKPAIVDSAAKVGTIEFTQVNFNQGRGRVGGLFTLGILIQALALVAAGFLFLHFRRSYVTDSIGRMRSNFWASLGLGLVGIIVIPVIIFVLFLTLVGYYAALIILFSFITLLLVNTIVASLFLGYFVLKLINKQAERFPDWQIVVLGVVLWEVLKIIPVLGWIILLILYLSTFGAALVVMRKRLVSS